jgi:methyltransferase
MMATQQNVFWVLLGLCILQRLFELRISKRNCKLLSAEGFKSAEGRQAFAAMFALHVGWFVAIIVESGFFAWVLPQPVWAGAVVVFCIAQALRLWAIASLGRHWNVSVMGGSSPETPFVSSGPYRFIRHPNYLAVVLEFVALPLVGGAVITAAAGTLLNGLVLAGRIATEERQLFDRHGYAEVMGGKARLLPGVW